MTAAPRKVSRRTVLKAGTGLVVGIAYRPRFAVAQGTEVPPRLPGSLNGNRSLSAWLRINPNGTVTVFTGKVELGQGIASALAQAAADELDVGYRRIHIVTADTSRTPDEGFTAGSQSIEQSGTAIRFACAEARQILLSAAAAKLGTVTGDLTVTDGTVAAPGGRRTTYWAVTTEALLQREATAQPKPKAAGEFKLIGQSLPRRDLPPKFTGAAAYLHDLRLPGMVHARVGRPPVPRAELLSLDTAALKALPGVIEVVRDGSFVAVVCEREEEAIKAHLALRDLAVWSRPELPPTLADTFDRPDPQLQSQDSTVYEKTAANAAGAGAVRHIEARYTRAFQLHASIGPSCAVAHDADGKLTVWTHSQGVFALRGDIARALGLAPSSIVCIHMEGAGCYGHNGADDAAFDAALLARAVPGRPVRVQWMRDDEFMWEPFGSAMSVKVRAGLSADGDIVDWQHELWSYPHSRRPGGREGVNLLAASYLAHPFQPTFPADVPQPNGGSDRNSIPLYDFPNQKILKHYLPDAPLRTSSLRTLGAYANVFAIESLMDEAAAAAGADPVEFRLRHLRDERARTVIQAAARKSGWRSGALGDSGGGTDKTFRGRGIGFARYKNHACYCAVIAQVEVDRISGVVRITRAWSAVDAGLAINPDGIVNQIEGGLIQSASWTLKEALKVDRSGIQTKSWTDYPILRFSEVPAVEVEVIRRPADDSLGVGEGAQGPTAAAIANAFASATGRRLRDIPFTPDRVRAALA
ncbi:MAG: aldehyde oxidase and xanthine dehydrogenase molybdopterin-binding protein [Gammaproteobacteria bacterium]|nr:aldehyde oxidase and xanthine dehydrogenase molybdopterin-binding protein [Gammaproteobacteria bacterium]